MKGRFLVFLTASVVCASCASHKNVVRPNDIQREWADAEIGVLIHFDMPVYDFNYNWTRFGSHPDASVFNPTELNTDQWLETAQKLGAKYAVLVAKHCSGFSLWPTEAHDYSVKNSPWKDGKGDIVADFIASCKKYGIKPGIYASTGANGYLHVNSGTPQKGAPLTEKEYYDKVVSKQLTELWSNYGELFEIWFDGGVGKANVYDLEQKLQPKAVAFQGPYGHKNLVRWVGNERGTAPDPCWATADSTTNSTGVIEVKGLNGRADAPFWCPGESDFTLRYNNSYQGGWFWREGEDDKMFNVDELMQKYETSVGRNTNMLLGIVVDNRGLVPDADVKRITEYGNAIRASYGTPTASTSGKGTELVLKLRKPTTVDRIILQENIKYGERILAWHLEGIKPDSSSVRLSEGTCIGHKRIARFDATEVTALKLVVDEMKAKPIIRTFSVFEKL